MASDARAIGPNIVGGNFDTYTSIKFLTPVRTTAPSHSAYCFAPTTAPSRKSHCLRGAREGGQKVTGISLISNKGNFVKPGDQCILTVIRQPGNINDQDHTSYRDKYQFTSSDESVATVAPVGVVTAHKVGNVTITCRLNDPYSGYPEATFELSVRKEGTAIPSRTWKYHFPVKRRRHSHGQHHTHRGRLQFPAHRGS